LADSHQSGVIMTASVMLMNFSFRIDRYQGAPDVVSDISGAAGFYPSSKAP
jgi:hypothetical protein